MSLLSQLLCALCIFFSLNIKEKKVVFLRNPGIVRECINLYCNFPTDKLFLAYLVDYFQAVKSGTSFENASSAACPTFSYFCLGVKTTASGKAN